MNTRIAFILAMITLGNQAINLRTATLETDYSSFLGIFRWSEHKLKTRQADKKEVDEKTKVSNWYITGGYQGKFASGDYKNRVTTVVNGVKGAPVIITYKKIDKSDNLLADNWSLPVECLASPTFVSKMEKGSWTKDNIQDITITLTCTGAKTEEIVPPVEKKEEIIAPVDINQVEVPVVQAEKLVVDPEVKADIPVSKIVQAQIEPIVKPEVTEAMKEEVDQEEEPLEGEGAKERRILL